MSIYANYICEESDIVYIDILKKSLNGEGREIHDGK